MAMGRLEVITSVERRRRWSRTEKERWVLALMEPGASSAEVARMAGVDRGLLYRWRRELSDLASRPGDAAAFVPVTIAVAEPVPVPEHRLATATVPAAISVEFGLNVRMKIEGAPDAATLAKVIGMLLGAGHRR